VSGPIPASEERPTARAVTTTGTPHSARVWDYWLGGKDHYAIDRAVGDRIVSAIPRQRAHVRANREFLVRAVEFVVREAGIRQILDIGTGLPTSLNVHEVAQAIAPDTRVVYVDNDPVVMAHARALMTTDGPGRVAFVEGDLRTPRGILDDPNLCAVLDLDRPVAVLMLAMLMFVDDAAAPCQAVRDLMSPLAHGSYLAATHTTADLDPAAMAEHVAAAAELGLPFVPRTHAQFRAVFEPELQLVPPGLVPVLQWRPRGIVAPASHAVDSYAGVARKP
jgi:S-adenosyl methyltransferase